MKTIYSGPQYVLHENLQNATSEERIDALLKKHGKHINTKTQRGVTPLHIAAKCASLPTVQKLLQFQANISLKTKKGFSALHFATQNPNPDVFFFLETRFGFQTTLSKKHLKPLHLAAKHGRHDLIEHLLKKNPKDVHSKTLYRETPLHFAAKHGHLDIAQALIAKGAKVDAKDAAGLTPLHYAISNTHVEIVRDLLSHNASLKEVSNIKTSALHLAVQEKNGELIELILDKALDIIDWQDENQMTALHYATLQGYVEGVQFLIDKKADIFVKNDQNLTALFIAVKVGHLAIVKLLFPLYKDQPISEEFTRDLLRLAYDGNHTELIDYLNAMFLKEYSQGSAIIYAAIENNRPKRVERFLDSDITIDDPDTFKPLCIAARYGHMSIVKLLIQRGACIYDYAYGSYALPVEEAFKNGHLDVAHLLLQKHMEYASKLEYAVPNPQSLIRHICQVGSAILQSPLLDIIDSELTNYKQTMQWIRNAISHNNVALIQYILDKKPNLRFTLLQVTNNVSAKLYTKWDIFLPHLCRANISESSAFPSANLPLLRMQSTYLKWQAFRGAYRFDFSFQSLTNLFETLQLDITQIDKHFICKISNKELLDRLHDQNLITRQKFQPGYEKFHYFSQAFLHYLCSHNQLYLLEFDRPTCSPELFLNLFYFACRNSSSSTIQATLRLCSRYSDTLVRHLGRTRFANSCSLAKYLGTMMLTAQSLNQNANPHKLDMIQYFLSQGSSFNNGQAHAKTSPIHAKDSKELIEFYIQPRKYPYNKESSSPLLIPSKMDVSKAPSLSIAKIMHEKVSCGYPSYTIQYALQRKDFAMADWLLSIGASKRVPVLQNTLYDEDHLNWFLQKEFQLTNSDINAMITNNSDFIRALLKKDLVPASYVLRVGNMRTSTLKALLQKGIQLDYDFQALARASRIRLDFFQELFQKHPNKLSSYCQLFSPKDIKLALQNPAVPHQTFFNTFLKRFPNQEWRFISLVEYGYGQKPYQPKAFFENMLKHAIRKEMTQLIKKILYFIDLRLLESLILPKYTEYKKLLEDDLDAILLKRGVDLKTMSAKTTPKLDALRYAIWEIGIIGKKPKHPAEAIISLAKHVLREQKLSQRELQALGYEIISAFDRTQDVRLKTILPSSGWRNMPFLWNLNILKPSPYSDIQIEVLGKTYHLHKCILSLDPDILDAKGRRKPLSPRVLLQKIHKLYGIRSWEDWDDFLQNSESPLFPQVNRNLPDLTIETEKRRIGAHRMILMYRFSLIHRTLQQPMQESQDSIIKIREKEWKFLHAIAYKRLSKEEAVADIMKRTKDKFEMLYDYWTEE